MRYSSSHWLAGGVLALAVLGGGLLAPSVRAQQPPGSYVPANWAGSKAGASGPGPVPSQQPAASPAPSDSRPASAIARQGDLLRYRRDVAGDAKPIVIDADQIVTWDQDGNVMLLLTGRVLVQQSVSQCRFNQGVAWVDMHRYQATGVLHMDLYVEGQVRIDAGGELADGGRAVLDLNTRGEFSLR